MMIVLSVIPYSIAWAALADIPDEFFHSRMAGREFPVNLGDGLAMWAKMVLCKQDHPEVDEPRCRLEIIGKVQGSH